MSINTEITRAMREELKIKARGTGDANSALRLSVLRAMVAQLTAEEVSGPVRRELSDADTIAVLKRMVKQRSKTVEEYRAIGQSERAQVEQREADIISEFIPAVMSVEDTQALVESIVDSKNLRGAGASRMGEVMGVIKSRDDVDSGVAARHARTLLMP